MKEMRQLMYEIRRLFRIRKTWFFIAVFAVIPVLLCTNLFGLSSNYSGTMANVFILYPAEHSAFFGVFAVLILTLIEMQRMTKYRMNVLIETATNPLHNQLRLTLSIITVALFGMFVMLCIILPYTWISMGPAFKLFPFIACWVFLYFGSILTTILLTSGFFMITRSLDISFIIVGILAGVSLFSTFGNNFMLYWVQTNVSSLSDASESYQQIDVILFTRFIWLMAAAAIYSLGLACIRRYGKNLLQSLLFSMRRVVFPLLALLLAAGAIFYAVNEPFFDKGPIIKYKRKVDPNTGIVIYEYDDNSFNVSVEQQNYAVTITDANVNMTVDTVHRMVDGEAVLHIKNGSGKEQELSFIISPGLDFQEAYENNIKLKFSKNKLDNFMQSVYKVSLTADKEAELRIVYRGNPKGDRQTQMRQWGITDKFVLIPYIYPVPNQDWFLNVDCKLNLPSELTPLMENTVFKEIDSEKDGYKTYTYQAMSPKWLIAGEYHIDKLNAGGQEIEFVYLKDREKVMKENNSAEVIADIVNFFTEKFGPLNFNWEPFIIAELDASFVNGGWGLGNMSVFGEASFVGNEYKSDPGSENIEGGSGLGVAVHEIAHQWWGWSPNSVYVMEDGTSPWSGEGLTVYSTYLYMKERFGKEYAKKEYTDSWEKDTLKMQNAFYLNNLQYVGKLSDKDASNIYSSFASVTRYEMMPYLLLKAEKLAGGEDAFVASLKTISQKYRNQQLSYDMFLKELGLTKEDLQVD